MSSAASSSSDRSSDQSSTKVISITSGTMNEGTFSISLEGTNMDIQGNQGLGLVVFDRMKDQGFTCPSIKKIFECSSKAQCTTICNTLENLKNGSLIIIGLKGDCSKMLTDELKKTISTLGSTEINRLQHKDAWAMMVMKGSPQTFYEVRNSSIVTFSRSAQLQC